MKFPKKKLLLPYLLAQHPSPEVFEEAFDLTSRYADGIELGIPFSDPVADGPIIREAAAHVLANGFRIESVFALLQRKRLDIPVALMSYANPILGYGREAFFQAAQESGAQGVIVPDVPLEESPEWHDAAREHELSWISFISLVTRTQRLQRIAAAAEGFVYLLSVTGITGADIKSAGLIREKAKQIRQHTEVPVALGFGVKTPGDAARFLDAVDAFIIGSRVIQTLSQACSANPLEALYREFRSVLVRGVLPC